MTYARNFDNTSGISTDEVYRRIPTLDVIEDVDIGHEVKRLTAHAPEYFWMRPGSYEGYHNGARHGLWHHTLKLSTGIETLKDTYIEQGKIREEDVDRAHAAAILHDQWKNGPDHESEQTSDDHPEVMGDIIRVESTLDDHVARAVEEHMGGWGTNRPASGLSELVHHADMLASDDDIPLPIYVRVPRELADLAHGTIELPE